VSLHDLEVQTLSGERSTLGALTAGKATLIVNVASKCGLTPQYAGREQLHDELSDRGFTVLGVP
jgi:glutathione peroxidase